MATVPPPNPKRPLPRPGTGEEIPREVEVPEWSPPGRPKPYEPERPRGPRAEE